MSIKECSEERRKRIVTNVAHSHEEAEDWDLWFWQQRTPQERLSALTIMQRDMERLKRTFSDRT